MFCIPTGKLPLLQISLAAVACPDRFIFHLFGRPVIKSIVELFELIGGKGGDAGKEARFHWGSSAIAQRISLLFSSK